MIYIKFLKYFNNNNNVSNSLKNNFFIVIKIIMTALI